MAASKLATQRVQVRQHGLGEAPGDAVARQCEHLAQAGAGPCGDSASAVSRSRPARSTGICPSPVSSVSSVSADAVVDIGQHARGVRIGRGHQAMAEAQLAQFLAHLRFQSRPRTEQLQAAADLQHDRMRELRADLRAETVGPSWRGIRASAPLPRGRIATVMKPVLMACAAARDCPGRRPSARAGGLTECSTRRCTGPEISASGWSGVWCPRRTPSSARCGSSRQTQRTARPPQARCCGSAMGRAGASPPRHLSTRNCRGSVSMAMRNAAGDGLRAAWLGRKAEGQAASRFGRHLQASQCAVVGLQRPAQHRGARARTQALLGRPQRIARRAPR